MATDIALSAAMRNNLMSVNHTQGLMDRTQARLSTGLKVASVLDDSQAFFASKALNDRASDLGEKKDGVDQGISSVSAAIEAIEAIDAIVKQMKGLATSARSATGTELTSLVTQFNSLRTQINLLTGDSSYQGLNLVNGTGSTLAVSFSNLTTSKLSIASVDLRNATTGLDITAAANFSVATNIDNSVTELDAAITTLRGNASTLGSNVALLQTRLDFTEAYVGQLEEGASKLTLADINEEGANLVALQTRQQLGIQALAFAGQSEQAVLSLFR